MTVSIDFNATADFVAQQLIGAIFLVDGIGGRIVETEAYDRDDPASHSFTGPTERNNVMFGEPAHIYVYRSYGIHWCLNFVCCESGHGAAVLIRAIEPLAGLHVMLNRRGVDAATALCSGPGKLAQALAITRAHNGLSLNAPQFSLSPSDQPVSIISGPRIGISKAVDMYWRYGLKGSKFLSRPFKNDG
jgi:DNA-3-methyladenine glycosylase